MFDQNQQHPCEKEGCNNVVQFDDEPFCFVHSADAGSDVSGYSYSAQHPSAETLMREHGIALSKMMHPSNTGKEIL